MGYISETMHHTTHPPPGLGYDMGGGGFMQRAVSGGRDPGRRVTSPNTFVPNRPHGRSISTPASASRFPIPVTRPQQPAEEKRKLYLRKVPKDWNENHIRNTFSDFGQVKRVTILRKGNDETTQFNRALLEMNDAAQAMRVGSTYFFSFYIVLFVLVCGFVRPCMRSITIQIFQLISSIKKREFV